MGSLFGFTAGRIHRRWCARCIGIETILLPSYAVGPCRSYREIAELCTAGEVNAAAGPKLCVYRPADKIKMWVNEWKSLLNARISQANVSSSVYIPDSFKQLPKPNRLSKWKICGPTRMGCLVKNGSEFSYNLMLDIVRLWFCFERIK